MQSKPDVEALIKELYHILWSCRIILILHNCSFFLFHFNLYIENYVCGLHPHSPDAQPHHSHPQSPDVNKTIQTPMNTKTNSKIKNLTMVVMMVVETLMNMNMKITTTKSTMMIGIPSLSFLFSIFVLLLLHFLHQFSIYSLSFSYWRNSSSLASPECNIIIYPLLISQHKLHKFAYIDVLAELLCSLHSDCASKLGQTFGEWQLSQFSFETSRISSPAIQYITKDLDAGHKPGSCNFLHHFCFSSLSTYSLTNVDLETWKAFRVFFLFLFLFLFFLFFQSMSTVIYAPTFWRHLSSLALRFFSLFFSSQFTLIPAIHRMFLSFVLKDYPSQNPVK
ncbi:hypothetical protein VP01_3903g2 [Puccinia sorghi]|uniref:Uncharacterized protein n=1 Tax=Puccinia sorghi TaxID=27349 RepID=A0A0L6UTI5_9BASI|nr:hypothetical protein VP01_3903g2 [Puccinia sorghi]